MNRIVQNAIGTGVPNVSINPNTNINDILTLPEIPCQREHKRRVKKMNQHFTKDVKSIHLFTLFDVVNDLEVELKGGETVQVDEGLYVGDGNTRCESMRQILNGQNTIGYNPTHNVISKIVEIETAKQMLEEYYSHDSVDASEITPDKIRGASKMLGLRMSSKVGMNGAYASALKNAYPGDVKDSVADKMSYFKKEIQILEDTGIFYPTTSDLRQQHFYGACLIAAKRYSEPAENKSKIEDIFRRISQQNVKTLKKHDEKWNGMTALIHQLENGDSSGSTNKKWYDIEYHKTTKYASIAPVISFILYCLELEMTDRKLDNTSGFKTSNWFGGKKNTNLYLEYLEDLSNSFPTV